MSISVYYGSQTGTAESIAQLIAASATQHGFGQVQAVNLLGKKTVRPVLGALRAAPRRRWTARIPPTRC